MSSHTGGHVHAPPRDQAPGASSTTPSPMEVLDHMLMLLERAKSIHHIWKAIQNMIDEPRDIHPVIQAFIIVIYVSPLYALVKGLVTTAPEPVCPFLGIQGLSFDECPAKDALLEVLTLASSSCGVVVMSAGGICICLFIDILSKFEVNEVLVMESQTMEHMIEDDCDGSIMLPNVNSKILSKVIERKQFQMRDAAAAPDADTGSKSTDVELKIFDEEFIKAATYLDMKVLLDLTCQSVSDMIKGKTPDEIGTTFDIKHDFSTLEEKEQVRR